MSGSLGRAPSVEADLDINLAPYAAKMKDARAQAEHLVKILEKNKVTIDLDTKQAKHDLSELTDDVIALDKDEASVTVDANTIEAQRELSSLERIMAQVDNARATVSAFAETDAALRSLTELRGRLDSLDDRPAHIAVRAEVDGAIRDLQNLRTVMGQVESDTVNVATQVERSGGVMSGALGGVGKTALGMTGGLIGANLIMGGVGAAMNLVTGAGIGLNAQLESTTIQFETMMGSADKAREHVAFLFEFAKKTPFETAPIIEASRFLQLFGKDALNTTENLTRIGNAAATAQAPIEELGFWIGRMYAAIIGGQPFGEASMRLQELGVLSAETRTEMERMQKAGADSAEIWAVYTSQLDKMDGAMEKQAGTWAGLTSTISDIVNLTAANLLAPWFEQAKDALSGLIGVAEGEQFTARMEAWRTKSEELATSFRSWVEDTAPKVIQAGQDAIPVLLDTAEAIGEIAVAAGNVIGPLLRVYEVLKDIRGLGKFEIDVPGTDVPFTFDVAQAPGGTQMIKQAGDIAAGIELVNSATERNLDVEKQAVDLANQHADARQRFINEHAYDPEYSGLAGYADLQRDANVAAFDAVGASQAQVNAARATAIELANQAEITNDLGLAQGQLAQYTHEYVEAAIVAANTDQELIEYQRDLVNAAESSNVTRREGLDTTRVTTEAEGDLEVALARVAAAYLALDAVQRRNVQAQNEINAVVGAFQDQGSQYSAELSSLEGAYESLQSRQEQGLTISATEQEFLDNYVSTHDRVAGAVEDAAIQEGLAAAAKVEVWRAQEDLNEAMKNGETDLTGYNDRLKTAQDYLGDVDPASGATQAIATLGTSIDKLVPLFEALLVSMKGVDDQEIDPEVTMRKDLFEKGAKEVEGDVITIGAMHAEPKADLDNTSLKNKLDDSDVGLTNLDDTIAISEADLKKDALDQKLDDAKRELAELEADDAAPEATLDDALFWLDMDAARGAIADFNLLRGQAKIDLDASQFYATIETANNMMPHSPAKEGPFKNPPHWGFLTENMQDETVPYVAKATEGMSDYLPLAGNPATEGPLSVLPDWDVVFDSLPGASEDASGEARQAFHDYIEGVLDDGDYLNDYLTHLPEGMREAAENIGHNVADSLDFVNSLQPPDWSFLFEGLDVTAEDFAKQATTRIADFITGLDVEGLATGDALESAEASLSKLINARAIAEQMGLGEAVLAELDRQVAAAQDEVNAIGAAMGTEVVQGLKASLAAGEAAAALADFREEVFTGNDFTDESDLTTLQSRVDLLRLARDAAEELGDTETVDRLNQQIADGNAELALMTQILGTDAVAAWQANADAAAEAQARAEGWLDVLRQISGAGSTTEDTLRQNDRDAFLALETAKVTPGVSADTIAQLQEDYDAAHQALTDYESAFDAAVAHGLFTQEELFEQAKQGGESLRSILRYGALTPDQIKQLYLEGSDDVRAVIEHTFGPEVIAGFNDINADAYATLSAFKPGVITEGWVKQVTDALADGRIDVQKAIALLTDSEGNLSEDAQVSLINTFEQLSQARADAILSGNADAITEAEAQYDAFMQFLIDFAAQHGLVVDDLLADWAQVRADEAKTAKQTSGTSRGMGRAAPEFDFQTATLSDLLSAFVDDFDRTLSDNLIDLVSAAQQAANYLEPETLDALATALGGDLAKYGLDDPLSVGAAVLDQLGLTPEDLRSMGLSQEAIDDLQLGLGEDFLDGSNNVVDAINRQTDILYGAITNGDAGGGSLAAGRTDASANRPPDPRDPRGPVGDVHVHNEIGGRVVDDYIVDVVTGRVQREI